MQTLHTAIGHQTLRRIAFASLLTLGAALAHAQAPAVAPADEGPDPALANMAPVTEQDLKYVATDDSYNQPPAPLPDDSAASGAAVPSSFQLGPSAAAQLDANQVSFLTESDQPPPTLPDFDQPDAPIENDIWNPGYWALGTLGYFWVPGFWTPAPFYGALWTPPYWGFYQGHYVFHPGYWGTHVGFYGGINYGFGYIGTGYFGGYWSGHTFLYNLAVSNVNATISSAYNRPVVYRGLRYGKKSARRISFNGGRGVSARPRPAERAAAREPHMAPTYLQASRAAVAIRKPTNYFSQNRGVPPPPAVLHAPPPVVVARPPAGNSGTTATTTTALSSSDPRYPPTTSTGNVATAFRKPAAETLEDARQAERTFAAQRLQHSEQMRAVIESRQNQRNDSSSAFSTRTYSTTSTVTSTSRDVEATRINRPPPPAPRAEMPRSNVNTERIFRPEEAIRTQPEEHPVEEKHPVEAEHRESGTIYAVPHEPNSGPHGTEPPREPTPKPEPPKPVPTHTPPPRPQPAPVQPHTSAH